MKLELRAGNVKLGPNQTLRVVDGEGTTVCAVEGAVWITDVMHHAGDASHAGAFRHQLARAELRRMLASEDAGNPF